AKTSVEGSSERSLVPDQLAQAAQRSDGQGRSYQRRGSVVHARTKEASPDYAYGQLELNLIRPEHETSSLAPLHGNLNAYYGSTTAQSIGAPHEAAASHEKALDDSETAAEYVVNAMKMAYGTRHKEQQPQLRQQQHQQHQQQQHLQHQQQQQHQSHQQQLEQEAVKQVKAQAQAALLEAQMQAELQAQLVEQQALLLAEQQRQQQPHAVEPHAPPSPAPVYEKESVPRSYEIYETPAQPEAVAEAEAAPAAASAATATTTASGGDVERVYRTKYYSYPPPQPYRNLEAEAEEKVRVSASTEIPKAEIMKQIEKSVIKYMKELEAEGKIITTPQELAPPATKTYYKLLSLPNASREANDEKRYSSSASSGSSGSNTVRSKYSSGNSGSNAAARQPSQYHVQQQQQQQQLAASHHQLLKPAAHALVKPQRYQAETETAYQAPELSAEALAPNVEFIYKIKTRAPLQTATVKTVSKPYTLPLKGGSAEHFDHGAAMKNIEEFDLSHVVTTPERELDQERVTSKPQKLYFNSEIYHDINSLPYKADKLRGSHLPPHAAHEYRHKLKASGELHPDYKGYSGYFAEPAGSMELAEKQPPVGLEGEESEELGYPIPYQYVLKKEPLSSKYEEERESWDTLRLAHGKPAVGGYKASAGSGASSLDYDSYSPKFNNNPEGYGYQHTYKSQQQLRSVGGGAAAASAQSAGGSGIKRGKRGGGAVHAPAGKKLLRNGGSGGGGGNPGGGKHLKDLEANLALRPPPK
ncbi:hypothetical protein KR093_007043, partial [Drosophila rubida]